MTRHRSKNNFAGILSIMNNATCFDILAINFIVKLFWWPNKIIFQIYILLNFLILQQNCSFNACEISDAHRNSVLSQDTNPKLSIKISSFLVEKNILLLSDIFHVAHVHSLAKIQFITITCQLIIEIWPSFFTTLPVKIN